MPISEIRSAAAGPGGSSSFQFEKGLPDRINIKPQSESGSAEVGSLLNANAESLKPEFLEIVKGFVGDVNSHQMQAGKAVKAYVAGEVTDLHQVTVALQEAGIALDLLIEIRNRTMDAFQEIMRMQV